MPDMADHKPEIPYNKWQFQARNFGNLLQFETTQKHVASLTNAPLKNL